MVSLFVCCGKEEKKKNTKSCRKPTSEGIPTSRSTHCKARMLGLLTSEDALSHFASKGVAGRGGETIILNCTLARLFFSRISWTLLVHVKRKNKKPRCSLSLAVLGQLRENKGMWY